MSDKVIDEDYLEHIGVLGMRWGHRKVGPSLDVKTKGITIKADGSIEVNKGLSLQRLTRSSGKSHPLKDITYASLTDYDNAKYIKYIGGKGFFGGGRDQVIKLTTIEKIKAPSVDEASKIVSDIFVNDPKFRNTFTNFAGQKISSKELATMKKDPTGKVAKEWYQHVNVSLTFDSDFDPTAPIIQKTVREEFQKKGFNAVRDENDFQNKVSKAPIIIFSPEKTLKVTKVSNITDELRKVSKDKLKQYNTLGRDWVSKQLYD